ncbi:hypothetical protein BDM02DRAFT_2477380 [Thelephora ganbajun]|uniref:Uncharacterized protein n=1 Tax=Thelephora ganbajun TaxID=370292 RepID=A0ACB6YXQ5_THEGA|nr:hypothetical protein BDM02DRAFT_2477380 [Thelephora ganbajun]
MPRSTPTANSTQATPFEPLESSTDGTLGVYARRIWRVYRGDLRENSATPEKFPGSYQRGVRSDVTKSPVEWKDGSSEKGDVLILKHLQYYIDQAGSTAREKYRVFLPVQSSAAYFHNTGADNDPGSVWYHQDNYGSIYTPRSTPSGLEAHIAAVKYGICY